jgi:gluconate kinase
MIAVVFRTPEPEEHSRRLASRPGKVIPDHVLQSMVSTFEIPTEEEGFDEIWYAES